LLSMEWSVGYIGRWHWFVMVVPFCEFIDDIGFFECFELFAQTVGDSDFFVEFTSL
jgi:hypothetical protein